MRKGLRAVGSALVTKARRATTCVLSGVIANGKPSTLGDARTPLAPLDKDASNAQSATAMPYTPMVV